jgi:hypothetical protein
LTALPIAARQPTDCEIVEALGAAWLTDKLCDGFDFGAGFALPRADGGNIDAYRSAIDQMGSPEPLAVLGLHGNAELEAQALAAHQVFVVAQISSNLSASF